MPNRGAWFVRIMDHLRSFAPLINADLESTRDFFQKNRSYKPLSIYCLFGHQPSVSIITPNCLLRTPSCQRMRRRKHRSSSGGNRQQDVPALLRRSHVQTSHRHRAGDPALGHLRENRPGICMLFMCRVIIEY